MGFLELVGYDLRTTCVRRDVFADARLPDGIIQGCRCRGKPRFVVRLVASSADEISSLFTVGVDGTAVDTASGPAETSIPALVPSSAIASARGLSVGRL